MLSALAIAHHDDYDAGLIGNAARQCGYQLQMVAREDFVDVEATPDPTQYDLIIPFGSAWSAVAIETDQIIGAQVLAEQMLLSCAHDAEVPIFGVCFGAQQLAAALGGSVRRAATPEIGWYDIDSDHPDVATGPWMQFHLDEIVAPPSAQVLARTTSIQAFRLGRSLGLQFHPEVTRSTIERWVTTGGQAYLTDLGLSADDLYEQCDHNAATAPHRATHLFRQFVESLEIL